MNKVPAPFSFFHFAKYHFYGVVGVFTRLNMKTKTLFVAEIVPVKFS